MALNLNILVNPGGRNIANNGNEITTFESLDIRRHNKERVGSRKEAGALHGSGTIMAQAQMPIYITTDHSNVSARLDEDIAKALQELKRSQESEYRLAAHRLYEQKDLLLSLYQQLEGGRSKLAHEFSLLNGDDSDALLTNILTRVDRIKEEEVKLHEMLKIGKGFGQTPKTILGLHFGVNIDE